MAKEVSLNALMNYISRRWKFSGEHYQGFDALDERGKQLFPLRHSTLHICKSLGRLASEAEGADHGDPVDEQQIRIAAAKLAATALNLWSHFGGEPEGLADLIEAVIRGEM